MDINITQQIIDELIKSDIKSINDLDKFKRKISGKFCIPILTNSELLKEYNILISKNKDLENSGLAELLKKRKIRTMSGVAPVAVLTKPYKCPGECIFCPTEKQMPKSYLSNEPAVMRAILTNFDPYLQVKVRIDALEKNGHNTDKIELIVMGGTWSYLPKDYQTDFIKQCFDACNNVESKNLDQAQKINETAKHRIIGLTLETRPDYINKEEIISMREIGCTRVELGVQTIDDYILQLNKRNIKAQGVADATLLLKNAGFKVCYHLMPNLPGADLKKDLEMFKQIFEDSRFKHDMIKIYPCVVTKNSKLYQWYLDGKYQPYTEKELINLLFEMKKAIPEYVRITRLIRDIPKESIVAGNKVSNLREIVQHKLKEENLSCKCIRCREAKNQTTDISQAKFFIKKYQTKGGTEYFLQYCSFDKKILYAFLRLRLPENKDNFITELTGAAMIREVHTYGKLVPINESNNKAVQHFGFGKRLMIKAEQISQEKGFSKMAVISGIGVREYYKKLGYQLEGTYMVKNFKIPNPKMQDNFKFQNQKSK